MKLTEIFNFKSTRDKPTPNVEERSCCTYQPSAGFIFGQMYNNFGAMNLSAVFRCVELISDGVSILPIHIKNSNNGEEYDEHQLARFFSDKVDTNINKYNFIKLLIQSVILKGNGYALIDRDSTGKAIKMRWLPSDTVTIQYNPMKDELYYQCSHIKGRIEPINIIHLKKLTNDGINGISVLAYAARTLGLANNAENASKKFFENGCNLNGVLTVNGAMTKEQIETARNNWNNIYTDGGSGVAILQGSMSYQPIQVSAADSQLLQTRSFNVEDIARFFSVPIALLDGSKQKYSSNEAVNTDFLLHTLQPYISMLEAEFNKKLLTPTEKNYLTIDVEEEFMIRADKAQMAQYYQTMLSSGVMSINEARHNLNMQPIEGGDVHTIAYSNVQQNTIGNVNNSENNNNENIKE